MHHSDSIFFSKLVRYVWLWGTLAGLLFASMLFQPSTSIASTSGLRLPFVGGPFTITNGPNEDLHTNQSSEAIDFSLSTNHDVIAAAGGVVIWARTDADSGCNTSQGPNYGFGNLVAIKHGSIYTFYAHLSQILVSEGQGVDITTVIGKQGGTGCAQGDHLHFEARTGVNESAPVLTGSALSIRDLTGITWNAGCPWNGVGSPPSGPCGSATGPSLMSTYLQIEVGIYDVTVKYPAVSVDPAPFNPLHPRRDLAVQVFNGSNVRVFNGNIPVNYDSNRKVFIGTADLGSSFSSGPHIVSMKLSNTLNKQVPGITTITQGTTVVLPRMTLKPGDVDNNNQITAITDYNILMGCFSDLLPAKNCDASRKLGSDLNDDGKVNQYDYNIFLRAISFAEGS